jgi:hypothetical protein
MALNTQQKNDVARACALVLFNGQMPPWLPSIATANVNHDDLVAAVSALDAAFDTTLNAAVASAGGTTTILNALIASLPAPASGGTTAQKAVLGVMVLAKRGGLF